jgi:hypothetical protein
MERRMVRKALAVGCIVVVLAAQAWTIFPPGGAPRERHWPFLDYPMYSNARHLGDSIILQELRAVRCDTLHTRLTIQHSTLHIDLGWYWAMVDRLARSPETGPIVDTLSRLTRSATHADICALEVWRQVLVVEQRGVRLEDHPWVRFREWTLPPDSGQRTLAPSRR